MSNLAGLPPLGLKVDRDGSDPVHLAKVRALPCCICFEFGLKQETPTQAHHCISGRHSQRRVPDCMAISLCEGHHTGLMDITKVAIHRNKRAWEQLFGPDVHWISWVEERIRAAD